jgi:uncharacterized protein YndB with AHSA1/START domain
MITVNATIHAAIEKIWDCWTNPKHIVHWNFASDDWLAPHATNDLQVGGKFNYGMAAKDGSFQFDFEGIFSEIVPQEKIAYALGDGRKVMITFSTINDNEILVTESFDPEDENTHELQAAGWQAILNNFKKYVEGTDI